MTSVEPAAATAVEPDRLSAWLGPAITALLGFTAVCATCWPGFMSPDSVEQLVQARLHTYADDHPPLMAILWSIVDRILPGPAGMLVFMNALYWGGLLVVARYWPLPRRTRLFVFAFVAAFPPLLVNLGVIWKDILMQGALVSLLACYLRYRRTHGLFSALLALVFAALAIGARHNAAPAAWPLLALLVAAHPRWKSQARPAARAALAPWKHALGALSISAVLVVALHQGVTRTLRPYVHETHAWQGSALFDLAGMSVQTGELLFDPELHLLRDGTTIERLRELYNPRHPGSLFYDESAVMQLTSDPDQLQALRQNWLRAVREHPGAYLKSRWAIYRNLLGLTRTRPVYMVFAGMDPNPYQYTLPASPAREAVVSAFHWLSRTPLFRVWLYVLGCLLLLLVSAAAAWSGGSALALALSASGIAYHLTFALLAASDDYRYSLWTITCAVLSACALPASWPEAWRAHPGAAIGGPAPSPLASGRVLLAARAKRPALVHEKVAEQEHHRE
ncbi:MAG TPA: hypothetical protein VFS67_13570 [Polyangiaceae bacterium]|nr:hypothetical protein [Polyangiaceae bacterium]